MIFAGQIVNAATRTFNTQYQIGQLNSFMASNDLGGGAGSFQSALANANVNLLWMSNNRASVVAYINATLNTIQWW